MRVSMENPKRPNGSIDKLFNRVLLTSFLLHLAAFFFVMNVEPPPPPSQEEYVNFIKKLAPVKEEIPEPEPEPEKKKEEKKKEEEEPEEVPEKAAKPSAQAKAAKPSGPPAKGPVADRRAEVRKQLSGAGLLAAIGSASDEGGLTNVFESGAVVGKDLGAALSERGGVRVTGGTRIGQKGALGEGTSADIGAVETGAGGSVGSVSGKQGIVPQAFVKSTEAVIKAGGIDEKGVRMALKRRERGIQQCYERALKTNAKLKGKVGLEWAINEEGRVVKIKVIDNSLGDPKVADCIMDIINRIKFPKATKGLVPIRKTFVFEAG